ncbi:heme lyase CcmF/NrfE family subunit [Glacieibacterium frigidum]|uniref:Uncharacterized protein n=1 Tax=Glacieibacterium frigidum TaxID=2593303 RepID=A0A552U9W1_9SPHN|nr:hypothetical protein [Glacieibacterium frigidum]TRW15011.1 hypothetical protein FMM06_15255 [Glacieibacterium frigidum]
MIAEIAHGLLWLASACAVLQVYAAWRLPELTVPTALAVGWLWLWIFGGLAWLFWSLDFSVAAVAANTQSALPESLRLAAAVLRPGGVWPVAAALVAWVGAVLAWRGAARSVLGVIGGVSVALHAVLLIAAPFTRLDPAPVEGAGFASVWRDRLATLGLPAAAPVVAMPFAVGARADGVALDTVNPVGGQDSTAIVGDVRVTIDGADLVLHPEWRETILPRHASGVPDTGCSGLGCWRATIGPPMGDARFMVSVARVTVWPFLAAAVALGALLGWAGLRARGRR